MSIPNGTSLELNGRSRENCGGKNVGVFTTIHNTLRNRREHPTKIQLVFLSFDADPPFFSSNDSNMTCNVRCSLVNVCAVVWRIGSSRTGSRHSLFGAGLCEGFSGILGLVSSLGERGNGRS